MYVSIYADISGQDNTNHNFVSLWNDFFSKYTLKFILFAL